MSFKRPSCADMWSHVISFVFVALHICRFEQSPRGVRGCVVCGERFVVFVALFNMQACNVCSAAWRRSQSGGFPCQHPIAACSRNKPAKSLCKHCFGCTCLSVRFCVFLQVCHLSVLCFAFLSFLCFVGFGAVIVCMCVFLVC